jgi:rubrerythrin
MTPDDPRPDAAPHEPPGHPLGHPMFSEPADEARTIGDEGLLEILQAALADERAAQAKYQRGHDRCVDPEACALFAQLLRDEQAHERALLARYTEVKKRLGLSGAGRGED